MVELVPAEITPPVQLTPAPHFASPNTLDDASGFSTLTFEPLTCKVEFWKPLPAAGVVPLKLGEDTGEPLSLIHI